jgi:porin
VSEWQIGPPVGTFLVVLAVTALTLPAGARADCGVTDTGIPENAMAAIDPAGIREALAKSGLGLGGFYVGEAFGNPSGGIKQGVTYDGVLELHLNGDMQKMGLWKGLCFHANAYQIHGQSITADNVGSLMLVSNFEATPATRLAELWLEQHMFNDRLAVKFGQLAADQDFIISKGGGYFLNATWGWPAITVADLPSGGPAYPLATPGVRVALSPNDKLGLMVAVFNGDPAGPNCIGDPQVCDNNGLDFRLDSPPLLMAEGAYKYNQKAGLPGTVKLGGWNHFGTFQDERFDTDGLPIAVTGNPGRPLDNHWGFYAIIDQVIWRLPGSEELKGVGLFGRVVGAPSDRNLVDFYADGGITFSGMIAHRPEDSLAIGFAYTGISNDVHTFDLNSGMPVARTFEALLEACYTMQLKPGWTLQPDLQYIVHPRGNAVNETGTRAVGNATVLGLRTTFSF